MNYRQVSQVYSAPPKHWVGNGFCVHSMFDYTQTHKNTDPFLLMDYASPMHFVANETPVLRGVGEHPHRGFETVTIAYAGEIAHSDGAGGGGVIGTEDVQWMTAGAGIMHEEFHSPAFSKTGGLFEMVQLWVNLPSQHKLTAPKYQAIKKSDIASVDLGNGSMARIIAGVFEYQGNSTQGAATTFSPINLWDLRLSDGSDVVLNIPPSHNVLILVQAGDVVVNDAHVATASQLVTFEKAWCDNGLSLKIQANTASKCLILTGEPLNEPIVGRGPFVMNSDEELAQAFADFRQGKFVGIQR